MGQSDIDAAGKLIINADSVILISHVGTEENHDKPEGMVSTRKELLMILNRLYFLRFL